VTGLTPAGAINLTPSGLTGLLQLKDQGKIPGTLSDEIMGVIELRDWYFQSLRVPEAALYGGQPGVGPVVTGTIGYVNCSFGTFSAVPFNQIWYVENMAISVGTAAASDVLSFACATAAPAGAPSQMVVGLPYIDTVTARQRSCVARADRAFWLPPGNRLGVWIIDIATGGVTFNLNARITPIPLS